MHKKSQNTSSASFWFEALFTFIVDPRTWLTTILLNCWQSSPQRSNVESIVNSFKIMETKNSFTWIACARVQKIGQCSLMSHICWI